MKKLLLLSILLFSNLAFANEVDDFLSEADARIDEFVNNYNREDRSAPKLEKLNSLLNTEVKQFSLEDTAAVQSELGRFYQRRLQGLSLDENFQQALRFSPVKRNVDTWVRSVLRSRDTNLVDALQIHLLTRLIDEEENRAGLWMVLESFRDNNISHLENRRRRRFSTNATTGFAITAVTVMAYATMRRVPRRNLSEVWRTLGRYLPKLTPRVLRRQAQRAAARRARDDNSIKLITDETPAAVARRAANKAEEEAIKALHRAETERMAKMLPAVVNQQSRDLVVQGHRFIVPQRGLADTFMNFFRKIANGLKLKNVGKFLLIHGPPSVAYGAAASVAKTNGHWPTGWFFEPSYNIFPERDMNTILAHALVLKQQCQAHSLLNSLSASPSSQVRGRAFVDFAKVLKDQVSNYAFLKAVAPGRFSKQSVPVRGQLSDGSYSFSVRGRGANKVVTYRREYQNNHVVDTFACPSFTMEDRNHFAISLSDTLLTLEQARHKLMRLQLESRLDEVENMNIGTAQEAVILGTFVNSALALSDDELRRLYTSAKNARFKNLLKEAILSHPGHQFMDLPQ